MAAKRPVAPEDNWALVANPSVLFDELPQPYRFVNKCLTELIMKPVDQAITEIEERKKTTEYEGFIKEASMTGSLDVDACTCIEKIGALVGPGGTVNKEEQSSISHKLITGDNTGQLVLVDVSQKRVLNRFQVPNCEGRRIMSVSSCSVEWVGTQLTYIACCVRGSPVINIVVFKHNDNVMKQMYTINILPDLANPDKPESNADQTYRDFPFEVKLSLDGVFLAVTQMTGDVKVIKMPPILNPLDKHDNPAGGDAAEKPAESKGGAGTKPTSKQEIAQSVASFPSSADPDATIMLKNDLEQFKTDDLKLEEVLIHTIPAKRKKAFVDPYPYDPLSDGLDEHHQSSQVLNASAPQSQPITATKGEEDPLPMTATYDRLLGNGRYKDSNGGDAGCLYKKPSIFPSVFFIRASFVNRLSAQMPHKELQYLGKSLKQFMITTGIGISYVNDFSV